MRNETFLDRIESIQANTGHGQEIQISEIAA